MPEHADVFELGLHEIVQRVVVEWRGSRLRRRKQRASRLAIRRHEQRDPAHGEELSHLLDDGARVERPKVLDEHAIDGTLPSGDLVVVQGGQGEPGRTRSPEALGDPNRRRIADVDQAGTPLEQEPRDLRQRTAEDDDSPPLDERLGESGQHGAGRQAVHEHGATLPCPRPRPPCSKVPRQWTARATRIRIARHHAPKDPGR